MVGNFPLELLHFLQALKQNRLMENPRGTTPKKLHGINKHIDNFPR